MNLSDFIADPARREALALACETSPDYLWQIAKGWRGRKAGPQLAQRIEVESTRIGPEGVSKESLRPDLWSVAPSADQHKAAA